MKIAVLLPCYNEEKTIEKVVRDFRRVLPEAYIYVYDNNSSDKSVPIVEEIIKEDEKVFLRHERRQGKGNVVRSMFRDVEADCYIINDSDDTYPAEHAREMADLVLNDGVDMVIGDRLSSTYFEENKRPFHNFGNVLVRKLINSIFKVDFLDIMTGYRAMSNTFVKSFPILSEGFEIETEMSIHCADKKFEYKEVPINYRDRPEDSYSKLNTYSDGFKVIRTIFRLYRHYKPFMFFGIWSLINFIIAGIAFIPIFSEYLKTGLVPRIPTLIVVGVVVVVGVILFFVGLMLDSIDKKSRQNYEVSLNYYISMMDKLKKEKDDEGEEDK